MSSDQKLLYKTKSLCPECLKLIDAEVVERDGKVYLEKACSEHGFFSHIYWSDAEMFKRVEKYSRDGNGVENPAIKEMDRGCPFDCGLCPIHKSHTALGIVDVTNRCNMRCPVCFDAAFATGYVYEPTLEQIKFLFSILRSNSPVPCPAVQITGGEPTVREDLLEIVKAAREAGFAHIELNTNGLKLAESLEYTMKIAEAGCTTVYLSFEGFSDKAYEHKGRNLLEEKLKAIENCRKAKINVVLVPTLVKGVNDGELGRIIEFAVENIDVIRCVNIQPISFVGRCELEEIEKHRITIPEAIEKIEEQTNGRIRKEDFYPVPTVVDISRFIGLLEGSPKVEFTTNVHCGMATYLYVSRDGSYKPIPRFINVDRFLDALRDASEILRKGGILAKTRARLKALSALRSSMVKEELPPELDILHLLKQVLVKRDYSALAEFHMNRVLMIGMMHFQDAFNLDLERLKRCAIHYPTLDGRLIPFCAMNMTDRHGRSLYRKQIEKKYSIPIEEWRRLRGASA